MNNQQQFDTSDKDDAEQQTAEQDILYPLTGEARNRQGQGSGLAGSDRTDDQDQQFGALNSLNPQDNGPKAQNAADEDQNGADIDAAQRQGGEIVPNTNASPADQAYQPDQYGSVREDIEQQIDASVDDYARRFPGGQQAAQHAKDQIAGVLDDFEQQAADGVADHNGLEGAAGGLG